MSDCLQALSHAPIKFTSGARIVCRFSIVSRGTPLNVVLQEADLELDSAITALHKQGDGRTEPPRPSADIIAHRLSSPLTGSGGERNDSRSMGTGEFAHLYRTIGVPEGHTAIDSSQENPKPWATSAASPRFLKDAVRAKSGCYTCQIRRKVSELVTR